jgi:hypothetical protein
LGAITDGVMALVIGLTGPAVVAMMPILIWRQARNRPKLVAMLVACGVAQLVVYLSSSRRPAPASGVVEPLYAFLRQTASSVIGTRFGTVIDTIAFPWLLGVVGILILIGILVCSRSLPRPTAIALAWASFATAIAGLISVGPASLEIPGQNGRYFLVIATFAALAAAAALDRRSAVGLAVAGVVVIGCVGDLAVDPLPPGSWASQAHCIGARDACVVDVYPPAWSVHWPGLHRGYVIPTGFGPDGSPSY